MAKEIKFDIVIDKKRLSEIRKKAINLRALLGDDIPRVAVSSVGLIGRRRADSKLSTKLHMGQQVTKYKDGTGVVSKVFSERNHLGAWSSKARKSRNGDNWMLSRYSWETARWNDKYGKNPKPNAFIVARFTSTLANLHNYDTKAYASNSPYFSSSAGYTGRFQKGDVRRGKHIWTIYETSLSDAVDEALLRTEKKFAREIVL